MMGTGPFAVPTFCRLYDTRHAIVALATSPLRTHRGKPIEPTSSIREVARQHGTEIFVQHPGAVNGFHFSAVSLRLRVLAAPASCVAKVTC